MPARANHTRRNLPRLWAALLCLGCLPLAQADQYHYVNMLVGDRAAGMGGAYVAVADDPAGLYYNPAGIVYAPGSNLSASMNAFNFTRTKYKNVLGGSDWVRTSSTMLPNYFGVIQPLGPGVLGFSYAVPDSILEDQDQTFPVTTEINPGEISTFNINFNNQDSSLFAGPSYALAANRSLSAGVTLYGYYREQEQILNQIIQFSDGHHWENSYVHIEEYGVKPLAGIMWAPLPQVAVGATLSKVYMLNGRWFEQQSCVGKTGYAYAPTSFCQGGSLSVEKKDFRIRRELPLVANMGAALFVNNALVFSGQFSLYQNMRGGNRPIWNAAGGMELYVTPRLALRGGLYTDHANTPQPKVGLSGQPEHVDLYGVTLSFSHFTRSSSISLGVNLAMGAGAAQIIDGNIQLQDVQAEVVTLFMSGAYSY